MGDFDCEYGDPSDTWFDDANILCIDHLRRKNCEGNPWCSYGLGENKDGIWKNHEFCLEQLCGRIQTVRALSIPAGLKNCGATCYLSVIFQVTIEHRFLGTDISFFNWVISLHRVYSTTCYGEMRCYKPALIAVQHLLSAMSLI